MRILIDANGRVGSVRGACIGTCDVELENECGARLRSYAGAFMLRAVNTFWPAGPTWCSTRGARHRIDYVLSDASDSLLVESCFVANDIDLTFNAYEDHKPVVVRERLPRTDEALRPKSEAQFRIDKSKLRDPHLCDAFQQDMWASQRSPGSSLDQWLSDLSDHVNRSATMIFGPPRDIPRKPWISSSTWSILRLVIHK